MKKITYLDGIALYEAFANGILNLAKHQGILDEINVYPVPDGDTGTNMVFTLLPIVEECKEQINSHVGETFTIMANTALDSARGNSGTIIAQFLYGMSQVSKDLDTIEVKFFAKALINGHNSARDSLNNPEEGTIITVMRKVADEAEDLINHECDEYYTFFRAIYKKAEIALKETKNTLKILKKSDVVDAGALGYVLIIQGILNILEKSEGGRIQTTHLDISYERSKIASLSRDVDFTIHNRFCTECVVSADNINKKELKDKIKSFGDSMVMAGSNHRIKVHIHTNEPAKLFKICNVYGKVTDRKVDDMTKQEKSTHHTGASSIAIIADSAADMPEEYIKEMHIVPLKYSFGRQQHIDKVTQSSKEFYEQMFTDSNHPKTSQPAPRDFKKTYNFISSHYSSILSIHLSQKVSGTYQSATIAGQNLPIKRIEIIDSKTASVGLGLLTMHAIELKQEGKSLDEIIISLNQKMNKTKIYLIIKDLSYIVRGGRLPSKVKIIANLLRLRPVLTIKKSGKMSIGGIVYGKSNMVNKFSKFINSKIDSNKKYRMLVAHANCLNDGEKLLNNIINYRPNNIEDNHLIELSGALGCHAGPGALIVGLQEMDL